MKLDRRLYRLLPALLAPLALGPASAQVQVGGGGNLLDANQQVGGGGFNPQGNVPDFRARNLLITGQVTDGRQFRGDVGYSAPGAFGGTLGSDDFFRFRADSFSSFSGATGFSNAINQNPFAGNATDLAGGTVIYNNFFTPGTASAGPAPVRTVVAPDGTRSAVVAGTRFNPEFLGVRSLANTTVWEGARDGEAEFRATSSLGFVQQADGQTLQLNASPVFGVTRTELRRPDLEADFDPQLQTSGDAINDPRRNAFLAPGDATEPGRALLGNTLGDNATGPDGLDAGDPFGDANDVLGNSNRAAQPGSLGAGDPGGDARRGSAVDARRGAQPAFDAAAAFASETGQALPGQSIDALAGSPLAVQLGARLTPGYNPLGNLNADAAAADQQRVTRLGDAIFRPLDATAAAEGQDAYLDLLRDIREQRDGAVPQPAGPETPGWMSKLDDDTTERTIRVAEENRLNAIATVLRAQRDAAIAQGRDPDLEATPGEAATTEAMRGVIKQLSYDLPRLETLRGEREDRVNRNFGLAEDAMAAGKFFNAVSLYRQLSVDAPGNPLARVGLTHAQMGAGMIRSAALQLRALFEDHPELIATRYAENLLPSEERFIWLRDELQRQIDDPEVNNADPGLMLAYVGHQIESRQLVRYGLAVAQQAAPLDPVLPLLRKVWLGEDE